MTVQSVKEIGNGKGEETESCGQQGQAGCIIVKGMAVVRYTEAQVLLHSVSFIFLISTMRPIMVVNEVVSIKGDDV